MAYENENGQRALAFMDDRQAREAAGDSGIVMFNELLRICKLGFCDLTSEQLGRRRDWSERKARRVLAKLSDAGLITRWRVPYRFVHMRGELRLIFVNERWEDGSLHEPAILSQKGALLEMPTWPNVDPVPVAALQRIKPVRRGQDVQNANLRRAEMAILDKFTVRIPRGVILDLRTISAERKYSKDSPSKLSEIVTEAIREWLARHG